MAFARVLYYGNRKGTTGLYFLVGVGEASGNRDRLEPVFLFGRKVIRLFVSSNLNTQQAQWFLIPLLGREGQADL